MHDAMQGCIVAEIRAVAHILARISAMKLRRAIPLYISYEYLRTTKVVLNTRIMLTKF